MSRKLRYVPKGRVVPSLGTNSEPGPLPPQIREPARPCRYCGGHVHYRRGRIKEEFEVTYWVEYCAGCGSWSSGVHPRF